MCAAARARAGEGPPQAEVVETSLKAPSLGARAGQSESGRCHCQAWLPCGRYNFRAFFISCPIEQSLAAARPRATQRASAPLHDKPRCSLWISLYYSARPAMALVAGAGAVAGAAAPSMPSARPPFAAPCCQRRRRSSVARCVAADFSVLLPLRLALLASAAARALEEDAARRPHVPAPLVCSASTARVQSHTHTLAPTRRSSNMPGTEQQRAPPPPPPPPRDLWMLPVKVLTPSRTRAVRPLFDR